MPNSVALAPTASVGTRRNLHRKISLQILARQRQHAHTSRKLYHLLMGMVCFVIYAFLLDRTGALTLLFSIGGSFILLDLARLTFPPLNKIARRVFGSIMRREEYLRLSANSFYILGLMVVTLFFPKPITLLSVLFLALGDPLGALVGTRWGQHKWRNSEKSVEGSLAIAFGCSLAAGLYTHFLLGLSDINLVMVALGGGFIAMAAELLPLPIDDNFSLPLVSALGLSVLNEVVHFIAR